jgi:hypothetical protein
MRLRIKDLAVAAAVAITVAATAVILPDLPEPPEDGGNHSGQYYYDSEVPPAQDG